MGSRCAAECHDTAVILLLMDPDINCVKGLADMDRLTCLVTRSACLAVRRKRAFAKRMAYVII